MWVSGRYGNREVLEDRREEREREEGAREEHHRRDEEERGVVERVNAGNDCRETHRDPGKEEPAKEGERDGEQGERERDHPECREYPGA